MSIPDASISSGRWPTHSEVFSPSAGSGSGPGCGCGSGSGSGAGCSGCLGSAAGCSGCTLAFVADEKKFAM